MKKTASASTTEFDEEAILNTLKRSEELAHFTPSNPEFVELLSSQKYDSRIPAFDQNTANISPLEIGRKIKHACELAKKCEVNGSGILSTSASMKVIGNSKGLRAYNQGTNAEFSFTGKISNGSSWDSNTAYTINNLPIIEMTEKVIEKAIASCNPQEVKPGVYPVILTPCAVGNLIPWVMWNLDARSADEGRSFMSLRDNKNNIIGNRLGESLFNSLVNIKRDSSHPFITRFNFF